MFVLSPEGNGMDCHRTWEALLLGNIPVVRRNPLVGLYDGLPVLVVDDWADVTRERLAGWAATLESKRFDFRPLFREFWMKRIAGHQLPCLDPMTFGEFRHWLTNRGV